VHCGAHCVEGAGAGARHGELWHGGLQHAGLGHTRLVWGVAGIGGGACKAALVRCRGVTQPGDVVVESMATRVGDARHSNVAATSASCAVATVALGAGQWGRQGCGGTVGLTAQWGKAAGYHGGRWYWWSFVGPCGGVVVFGRACAVGSWCWCWRGAVVGVRSCG
jgi:hypothetical protein